MRECFETICNAVDKAKIELEDMESTAFYYQKKAERLEAEIADLKKHCEWLEGNLDLKNTVIADLRREIAALKRELLGDMERC